MAQTAAAAIITLTPLATQKLCICVPVIVAPAKAAPTSISVRKVSMLFRRTFRTLPHVETSFFAVLRVDFQATKVSTWFPRAQHIPCLIVSSCADARESPSAAPLTCSAFGADAASAGADDFVAAAHRAGNAHEDTAECYRHAVG